MSLSLFFSNRSAWPFEGSLREAVATPQQAARSGSLAGSSPAPHLPNRSNRFSLSSSTRQVESIGTNIQEAGSLDRLAVDKSLGSIMTETASMTKRPEPEATNVSRFSHIHDQRSAREDQNPTVSSTCIPAKLQPKPHGQAQAPKPAVDPETSSIYDRMPKLIPIRPIPEMFGPNKADPKLEVPKRRPLAELDLNQNKLESLRRNDRELPPACSCRAEALSCKLPQTIFLTQH